MIDRPLAHTKVSWFIELAPPIHLCVKSHQSGLIHSLKDTRFETIVHIEITQKIPHSCFLFKLKLLKYVGDCCKICVFQKFKCIIGFYGTVQT